MATDRQRYMISVNDEMFKEIEDYRFENRFQTRSEATQSLIAAGLKLLSDMRQTLSEEQYKAEITKLIAELEEGK